MPTVVIVGAQWGDEGKGKIVDFCTEYADVVVRYAGGPNAGHTLVVGDDKLIVRLDPERHPAAEHALRARPGHGHRSRGARRRDRRARARGLSPATRLFVSDRAHVILPFHVADRHRCARRAAKAGRTLGTTKRGIGPAYEDKAARRGLRMGALARSRQAPRASSSKRIAAWAPTLRALGGEVPSADAIVEQLRPLARAHRARSFADTSRARRRGDSRRARACSSKAPRARSSTSITARTPSSPRRRLSAGGAAAGAASGRRASTRSSASPRPTRRASAKGPFPTELHDATGDRAARRRRRVRLGHRASAPHRLARSAGAPLRRARQRPRRPRADQARRADRPPRAQGLRRLRHARRAARPSSPSTARSTRRR